MILMSNRNLRSHYDYKCTDDKWIALFMLYMRNANLNFGDITIDVYKEWNMRYLYHDVCLD